MNKMSSDGKKDLRKWICERRMNIFWIATVLVAYSNVNFNLLGAVIEQVTGRSYRDYMEQEIIMPLGLEHTYVGEPERADEKKAVVDGTRLLFRKAITYYLPVREGAIPAGYFYSNGTDMALWMEIWLGVADVPSEYQELIREIKVKLVKEGDYYAGWERFENGQIGHSGGTPNYSSRIVFSESENVGACVLTNLNVAASTDSLCNGLLDGMTEVQGKTGKQGMTELIKTDVWTVFDRIFTGL